MRGYTVAVSSLLWAMSGPVHASNFSESMSDIFEFIAQSVSETSPFILGILASLVASLRFYGGLSSGNDRKEPDREERKEESSRVAMNDGEEPTAEIQQESEKSVGDNISLLLSEIRLERNRAATTANMNLSVGLFFAISSIIFLLFVAFSNEVMTTTTIVVRSTVSIFGSAFAFFFLQLYRQGMKDRQFYQNEITSLELKVRVYKELEGQVDSDVKNVVLLNDAAADRNAVLLQAAENAGTSAGDEAIASRLSMALSDALSRILKRE